MFSQFFSCYESSATNHDIETVSITSPQNSQISHAKQKGKKNSDVPKSDVLSQKSLGSCSAPLAGVSGPIQPKQVLKTPLPTSASSSSVSTTTTKKSPDFPVSIPIIRRTIENKSNPDDTTRILKTPDSASTTRIVNLPQGFPERTPRDNEIAVIDVLTEASELLKTERLRKAYNLMTETMKQMNPKNRDKIQRSKVYKTAHRRFNIISEALSLFTGKDTGWVEAGVHKGIRSCWREEKTSKSHSVMVEGVINASLVDVALVAGEMEKFTEWFPMLREMNIVKEYGPYSGVAHGLQGLPWPLSNRDYVTERCVDINPAEGYVVIAFKTMPQNCFEDPTLEAPPVAPNYVRAEILQGGTFMKPLGPNTTLLKCIGNVDLKIPVIPSSILNNLARHISLAGFRNVVNICESETGALHTWYQNKKKNRWDAVYKYIQEVSDESAAPQQPPTASIKSPKASIKSPKASGNSPKKPPLAKKGSKRSLLSPRLPPQKEAASKEKPEALLSERVVTGGGACVNKPVSVLGSGTRDLNRSAGSKDLSKSGPLRKVESQKSSLLILDEKNEQIPGLKTQPQANSKK
eukprot:Platyproteum_vivax@DN6308_c0_g1_i2.p1